MVPGKLTKTEVFFFEILCVLFGVVGRCLKASMRYWKVESGMLNARAGNFGRCHKRER
jgi:hypothetical protein